MERIQRNRKTFDEKENDHKHLNKKTNMISSLTFKPNQHNNQLKVIPLFSLPLTNPKSIHAN